LIILGAILRHQLFPSTDLVSYAAKRNIENTTKAKRGSILDATGHYLAVSAPAYKLGISPRDIPTKTVPIMVHELAEILDKPPQVLTDTLENNPSTWQVLVAEAPWSTAKKVLDLGYISIDVERMERRIYPNGELAAPVLGFVNRQTPPQANYGIERRFHRELHGKDGVWFGIQGLSGRSLLITDRGYRPVQDGADIVLTIDRNIQYRAEAILRAVISDTKASSGNLIVMDPRTGAILAMANLPTYDPGHFWQSGPALYQNTCISAGYEPGSVVKALTLAAALETRVIRADYVYDDRGEIRIGGCTITNSDKRAHGATTMTEMMAYSLNVGAAHLATLLGSTRFYESLRDFGFGSLTGIDLDAEASGILRVPGWPEWTLADLGAHSYGQGISVTPLQVTCAFAAIANNGVLMRPYVASQVQVPAGQNMDGHQNRIVKITRPFHVRRVLTETVALQMHEIMADAMEIGAPKAVVPGYRFAGKSGTAEISGRGEYTEDVIASFVGFGPLPDPRFVILVKVDKPEKGQYGMDVAAPQFRKMAQYLIDYYGIQPDVRYAER